MLARLEEQKASSGPTQQKNLMYERWLPACPDDQKCCSRRTRPKILLYEEKLPARPEEQKLSSEWTQQKQTRFQQNKSTPQNQLQASQAPKNDVTKDLKAGERSPREGEEV